MAYTFKHGDRPLDDYTIQRGVGRGGFGEVYYAISDGGREVAIKYLRDNPDIELRGVSACMNLKSPHLVTIFDVKRNAEGEYFIIMEYVSGPSLRDLLIAEPNGLGPQKAAYFVRELAKGLSYLHDRGIVHRDLKPGNIFYEDGYVKIGDYGLSKFISVSRHSAQTSSVGTVHYMAPEIGSGSYSRGVDIYALGVMLYEMLLGRVPFEGASLGEVLMKHLTEQPEVDELPHPFGQVIRRALAKDPKNRYQTVEEMGEELFGVDDIKQSLAGFNPQSLSGAVRRAAGDAFDSPMPSPNPPRAADFARPGQVGPPPLQAGPPPQPPRLGEPIGGRLGKRMDRVSRKLDRKLAKLGGRPRGRGGGHGPGPGAVGQHGLHVPGGDRLQRVIMSGIMAMGVAVGIGLLIGFNVTGKGDQGIVSGLSAFLFVAAMSGSVMFSRWLLATKLSAAQPHWVPRMILAGCCLPTMLVASLPLAEEVEARAFAVFMGLFVTAMVADWEGRLERGARGELQVGRAVYLAIFAVIAAAVFQAQEFSLVAGAVAAATSLCVQALAWAWQPGGPRRIPGAAPGGLHPPQGLPPMAPVTPPESPGSAGAEPPGRVPASELHADDIPMAIPMGEQLRGVPKASAHPLTPKRSMFVRAFWSVVAFVLAGGAIALFVTPMILDLSQSYWHSPDLSSLGKQAEVYYREAHTRALIGPIQYHAVPRGAQVSVVRVDNSAYAGVAAGCVACVSFLVFALRKTTQRRRPGFWRETLRPFLIAVAMTGMGASIAALATPGLVDAADERAGVITGVVFSSLLFVLLLFLRGRRPHAHVMAGPAAGPQDAQLRFDGAMGDDAADEPRPWSSEGQPGVPAVPRTVVEQRPARMRSAASRCLWGVISFLLAGGMIALFVVPVAVDFRTATKYDMVAVQSAGGSYNSYRAVAWGPDNEVYMSMAVGCIACLSFLIFALRKTTRQKRPGFWQETLRPFLTALAMTGLGASISALAIDGILGSDEERIGAIVGLVFSSLLLVVTLFVRGQRHRRQFVVAADAHGFGPHGVSHDFNDGPPGGGQNVADEGGEAADGIGSAATPD